MCRLYMWSQGLLDSLQQDMAVKNLIFLMTFSGAYTMYTNTITRDWNKREILTFPFVLKYPSRERQFALLRVVFVASHLAIAAVLTYVLAVGEDDVTWYANLGLDAVLCLVFLVYARNIHIKAVSALSGYMYASILTIYYILLVGCS
jgi:hypothetical protein